MNYLLDTNIISELIAKKPNQRVIDWIDDQDAQCIYLSVLTIGEVRKGIAKLGPTARAESLLEWLMDGLLVRFQGRILNLDVPVILRWGELTGQLSQHGRVLAAIDSLIAATALYHRCTLVTRNDQDFLGTNVQVVNPWH